MIFFFSPFAHPTAMIKKEVFEKVGAYYDEKKPAEDLEFWFRAGTKYKFANLNKILLKYRYHPNSTTGSRLREMEIKTNQTRWIYSKDPNYYFGPIAFLYNYLHLLSINIVPAEFKAWLFFKLRDRKSE